MVGSAFQSELSGREPDELEQYRSVSGLAICALLLGVVSIASLAHPAAWLIPLVAVLCGAVALIKITRQPDALSGRPLALTGMALGLFFGVCAVTQFNTDRWVVTRQALEFSDQWLDAVAAGELEAAHQATLDYYLREPEGTQLVDNYQQDPEQLNALQDFFSEDVAKKLVELEANATRRLDRIQITPIKPGERYINLRYFIEPLDKSKPIVHLEIKIEMLLKDEGIFWTMLTLEDAEFLDQPRNY
ncbi:MAG: DUF4190 domain-containing protein [Planctomycetaceae bacterium]|nr:DUF4190 domain-containing protein [Planctomycetaceae bacterium]